MARAKAPPAPKEPRAPGASAKECAACRKPFSGKGIFCEACVASASSTIVTY